MVCASLFLITPFKNSGNPDELKSFTSVVVFTRSLQTAASASDN